MRRGEAVRKMHEDERYKGTSDKKERSHLASPTLKFYFNRDNLQRPHVKIAMIIKN